MNVQSSAWIWINWRKISIFIDFFVFTQFVGFVLCIFMLSQNLPSPSGIKWLWRLCLINDFLHLKFFSQILHGMEIPSKWFDSIWDLMLALTSSFPQTLQEYIGSKVEFFLEVFFIIEVVFSSSSAKSPEKLLKSIKLGYGLANSIQS